MYPSPQTLDRRSYEYIVDLNRSGVSCTNMRTLDVRIRVSYAGCVGERLLACAHRHMFYVWRVLPLQCSLSVWRKWEEHAYKYSEKHSVFTL